MRLLGWSSLAVVLVAAVAYLLERRPSIGEEALEQGAPREADGPRPGHSVLLKATPTSPRVPTNGGKPGSGADRKLTPEQQLIDDVRRLWEAHQVKNEALLAAGLLSAEEVDASRLEGLLERRYTGEWSAQQFYLASAEIHARRVARREAAHAAGHTEELDLRGAKLDLADALAEASGDNAPYTSAWREHFDWLLSRVKAAEEAGSVDERAWKGKIGEFLRLHPWPRGTVTNEEAVFAPYLPHRLGWVTSVDTGPAGVRRVRIVFGAPTQLEVGHGRDLYRGNIRVATVEIEQVERNGALIVARILEGPPEPDPRVGDLATSD